MQGCPPFPPVLDPAQPGWTVLCDFDGTIAHDDVIDSLLLRFGRAGWDRLEADWRDGRIGSRECLAGQVALLDMSRDELDEHLASIEIDADFAEFVGWLQRHGMPLHIVSDGLDLAIHALLRRCGLDALRITANHLVADGPRRWRLEFPNARPTCRSGTCKCAVAEAVPPGHRVLMVGDGASDFCVARRADLVFARKRLLECCLDEGLPMQPAANFAQALALVRGGALDAAPRRAAARIIPLST